MKFEYGKKIVEIMQKAEDLNHEKIISLANKFAENIENDHIIHTFGTGHSHMIGIELFARAGGLGNVNAILDPDVLTAFGARRSGALEKLSGLSDILYDTYKIEKGDIMIISSNSGRNAMPIEMAMRAKKEGVYTVAVTNLAQSQKAISRHASGKKLYECVDIVIDTCVPEGDAMLDINGIKTGPASSIVSMFLLNTIVSEAIKILDDKGIKPYVFQSQNVDGFNNDSIYEHYEGKCRHF